MKVLLISPNRYKNPMAVMPMGACVVADAAEKAGHYVRLLDLMFSRHPRHEVLRALQSSQPDLVGISVRNIDNNDVSAPEQLCAEVGPLVDMVHTQTQAPVVLGGAALGVMPEALLRSTRATLGVLGDGEAIFPQLLNAIEAGESWKDVPGIGWIEDKTYRSNPGFDSQPLEGACAPRYERWLDTLA